MCRPSFPRSSRARRPFRRLMTRVTCGAFACESKAQICRRPTCRGPVRPSTATSSRSSMRRLGAGPADRDLAKYLKEERSSKATILIFAPRRKVPCAASPAHALARKR